VQSKDGSVEGGQRVKAETIVDKAPNFRMAERVCINCKHSSSFSVSFYSGNSYCLKFNAGVCICMVCDDWEGGNDGK
jgi:hypothetical protein